MKSIKSDRGIEIFVIDGGFSENGEEFEAESWLRLPLGSDFNASVVAKGARVWIKSDHLEENPTAPKT